MGIQTFFSTIRNNKILSKCVNERKNSIHKNQKISGLFLDFNAIIHDISAKILEQLNKKYLYILKNCRVQNFSETNFKIYNKIKNDILKEELGIYTSRYEINTTLYNEEELLTDLIIYKIGMGINTLLFDTFVNEEIIKVIYISIDGVPSKGKLVEQISRSYSSQFVSNMNKNILENHKHELNINDEKSEYNKYAYEITKFSWVKYHIQPGTEFMGKLSSLLKNEQFLKEIVLKNFKNKELYSKIILSDFREIGEGEIKILNYIRYNIKNKILDKDDIISIFSPDADVILLSALIPFDYISNIKLFRYADRKKNFKYWVTNIKKLKALLFNNLQNISTIELNLEYLQRYIDDIVFIFSLFGDDFIPRLKSYNTSMHFDYILNCYTNAIKGDNFITNTKNLTIDNTIFKDFIRILSIYEDNAIAECFLYDTFDNFKKWDNHGVQQRLSKYNEYWMIIFNKSITCYKLIKNIFERNLNEIDINNNLLILNNTHSKYIEILYNELIIKIVHRMDINSYNENVNLDNEIKKDTSNLSIILKFFKQYYIFYRKMPRIKTLVLRNKYNNNQQRNNYNKSDKSDKYDIIKKSFIDMKDSQYFNWTNRLNKNENIYSKLGYIDSLKNISKKNLPFYYFSDEIYYGRKFERTKNIYYKKKLKINTNDELTHCIKKYLNGLMWVFYSYNDVNNPLMNKWTYGYDHSPLLQDIIKFYNNCPNYDMNLFNVEYSNSSESNIEQYFTPFHKILYTTPMEGIIKVLPEYRILMESLSNSNLLEKVLIKLGIKNKEFINKAKMILCNKNFPIMKQTAMIVFNNINNNVVDCSDAMYISKCKFNILNQFHKDIDFDTNFISVINEINKHLKFRDKSLNNSLIPNFYFSD